MSGCELVSPMMKYIISRLMLSCIAATELVEKGVYFRLNLFEKIKLKLHTRMCGACHNYMVQSIWLHRLLVKIIGENHIEHTHKQMHMPDGLKSAIISKINAQ